MISYESVHIVVIFLGYHKIKLKDRRNCNGQTRCVAVLDRKLHKKKEKVSFQSEAFRYYSIRN